MGIDRSLPVWVLAALALLVLMALPLGWLGYMSVSGGEGATLVHYRQVFTDPQLQKALWNTVVLAFWVGLASLAIGAPMAWLTARTDLPGKRLIRGLIMASFVTPPFLGAFAWVMLAGPNAGLLNKLYRALTGAEDPLVNVFSMPGLIFVVSIYTFPYVFIMIANTLELIASDLEDAASILGAGRVRVALTVTLPMVLPAIASGFILAVLQALALFGSPAILALPAGRRARVGPAADGGELHAGELRAHVRAQRHAVRDLEHAGTRDLDRVRGRGAGRGVGVHRQPEDPPGPSAPGVPRARARGYPRGGPGGRAVRRVHAPAARPLRQPLDPLRRVPHEGDARGLRAVRRHLQGRPSGARGSGTGPRRGPSAGARRDHGAAGPERGHRHVVLRLHRRDPRALGVDHPLHAEHEGDLGRDLRPQGGGPVRRHRRPRPLHARHDLRRRRRDADAARARLHRGEGVRDARCPG